MSAAGFSPRLFARFPLLAATLLAAALAGPAPAAQAEDGAYPSKPIKVLVPFGTGGTADTLARVLSQDLGATLGQPIVVENRPGAGGTVGMEAGKRMPADGYGYILVSNSQEVSQAIYPELSYDLEKDFIPMSVIADSPIVIAANPSVPIKNMAELIAYARKNPGKLNYGSCGVGTAHHLAMEIVKERTKADIMHTPYRSCGPAVVDAVGGQVQLVISSAPTLLPHFKQGKLVPLAVTNPKRSDSMPEVPTIAESGVPELAQTSVGNWYAFMAPAGTPADRIAKMDAAVRTALAKDSIRRTLATAGIEVGILDAKEHAAMMRSDIAQFAQVVKAVGIKPE